MTTSDLAPVLELPPNLSAAPELLRLLAEHSVQTLVDARTNSDAGSPELRDEALKERLAQAGIRYVFLGAALGGASPREESFAKGLEKLVRASAQGMRTALLASPSTGKEITRALTARGVPVRHVPPPAAPEFEEWDDLAQLEDLIPPEESDPDPLPLPPAGTRIATPGKLPTWEDAPALLRSVFGYDTFRPVQENALRRVVAGQDTLAVMPTGGGKSLIYQLPALMFEGVTVVVSPLISLMRDQVEQLRPLGIAATFLNSSLTRAEWENEAAEVAAGRVKIVYVAPETLVRADTLSLLDRSRVSCIAIDEAHCISHWGHDFRPVYRQLLPIRQRYSDAVCIALTATAAPRVRQDIQRILSIPDEGVLVSGFDRPNLFLAAARKTDAGAQLVEFLRAHAGEPGIVYCPTQKLTEALAADLTSLGIPAKPYHAGLETAVRNRHQREFNRDEIHVIVATVAFGMGINKPNIRFVAHHSLPESLEGYYQEIGRAGRDGLRADCLLLFGQGDARLIRRFIEEGAEAERAGRQARLNAMMRYAASSACRRAGILPYFGDEDIPAGCGMCDNCVRPADANTVDVTEQAKSFLNAIQQTRQSFGISHIIDVLRGSQNRKLLDRGHDKLPAYNSGAQHSANQWRAWIDVFLDQGLIEQDLEFGSLRFLPEAQSVLRDERKVMAPAVAPTAGKSSSAATDDIEYNQDLFQELRRLRKEIADGQGVPPFVVFSDRTLVEMARLYPQSEAAFLMVNGIGQGKLATYGERFLTLLRDYCGKHGLQEQSSATPPPAPKPKSTIGRRAGEVGRLFNEGLSFPQLQERFGVQRSTIVQNLVDCALSGATLPADRLRAESHLSPEDQAAVLAAFAKHGTDRLRPIFDELSERIPYEELHLLRLYLRAQAG
jgi:ATP-dependent DNA helicase RecQ